MLGVNIYNSIVDARSWSANIPDSILTARNYFKTVNPRNIFPGGFTVSIKFSR